jgi:hypothetical protein
LPHGRPPHDLIVRRSTRKSAQNLQGQPNHFPTIGD